MKKIFAATAVSVVLVVGSVHAQTLEPQMSAQDVRAAIDPNPAHMLVPILMMIFLVAATSNGAGAAGPVAVSDERLKTEIRPVGQTVHGLTLYEFRYIGQPELWRGVMAQEVAEIMPSAVHRHDTGYLLVDYDALGTAMERAN